MYLSVTSNLQYPSCLSLLGSVVTNVCCHALLELGFISVVSVCVRGGMDARDQFIS